MSELTVVTKTGNKLFDKKNECTGCGACIEMCPVNAIVKTDYEGFSYPIIKPELCIGCDRCIKYCPLKNKSVI